uniref:DUF4220 domain-containing protein n=1 Tax=Heterorhabditis bacteriophora TaxID=37862 RepID=A0A1I7WAV9_HETBA
MCPNSESFHLFRRKNRRSINFKCMRRLSRYYLNHINSGDKCCLMHFFFHCVQINLLSKLHQVGPLTHRVDKSSFPLHPRVPMSDGVVSTLFISILLLGKLAYNWLHSNPARSKIYKHWVLVSELINITGQCDHRTQHWRSGWHSTYSFHEPDNDFYQLFGGTVQYCTRNKLDEKIMTENSRNNRDMGAVNINAEQLQTISKTLRTQQANIHCFDCSFYSQIYFVSVGAERARLAVLLRLTLFPFKTPHFGASAVPKHRRIAHFKQTNSLTELANNTARSYSRSPNPGLKTGAISYLINRISHSQEELVRVNITRLKNQRRNNTSKYDHSANKARHSVEIPHPKGSDPDI